MSSKDPGQSDEKVTYYVADSANPERHYSVLDANQFEPEFGPFVSRAEAEDFAAMRPMYQVVTRRRPSSSTPVSSEV